MCKGGRPLGQSPNAPYLQDMKKPGNAFKKTAKHTTRKVKAGKAKAKGDVVSHRSKKHVPRNHPYSEVNLSPDR